MTVVGQARRELESWRSRYAQYPELRGAVARVDEVLDRLKR
jgi:hypothetical protein